MSELINCINNLSAKDILRASVKTANGAPFYIQTGAVSAYSDEYQAVYDSFTTKPDAAIAAAQNTLVETLVSSGVWAILDVFYLFAQTTNGGGEALINWIAPGTFTATLVNAPAFVALEGFTGNGANQYIRTGFIGGGIYNYQQNSASFGSYIRTNTGNNGYDIGCETAGADARFYARQGDDWGVKINDGTAATNASLDSRGFWVANRSTVNNRQFYKNAASILSDVRVAVGVPGIEFYILTRNNAGSPSGFVDTQHSAGFLGGSLTQPDATSFTNAIEVYMDSNGKGVIP